MTEKDLMVFVEGIKNYFLEVTTEKASLEIPYVKGSDPVLLDYTGVISISGDRKGAIYVTTTREMIEAIGKILLNSGELDEGYLPDLIGEIANTLSGYVRIAFGHEAMISIPMVLKGRSEDLYILLETPAYVIPFSWRGMKSYMVVGIQ